MARGLSAALLLGFPGLVAGCAEPAPPTLAVESVVAGLPAAVWPAEPALVADVDCPTLDPAVIAQSSVCHARLHGEPLTVDVVVDAVAGVTATVREPLFVLADVEAQLENRLRVDLGAAVEGVTVTCEPTVIVARPGAVVGCVAERSGDPIEFEIELVDESGEWRLDYLP